MLVDHIDALRAAVATTRERYPFAIDAVVVLPDHIHAVWTLPPGDADFSLRWRLIKQRFARGLPKHERISAVRRARHERGIWQRRFWEHLIRDEADYARHVEYCYINPVKHGLVSRARDWPHSSFHRDVRAGSHPAGLGARRRGKWGVWRAVSEVLQGLAAEGILTAMQDGGLRLR